MKPLELSVNHSKWTIFFVLTLYSCIPRLFLFLLRIFIKYSNFFNNKGGMFLFLLLLSTFFLRQEYFFIIYLIKSILIFTLISLIRRSSLTFHIFGIQNFCICVLPVKIYFLFLQKNRVCFHDFIK